MIRINDILDTVAENYPDIDLDIIDRSYIYSARVHAGQVRLSGEPYLSHPLEVAGILAKMKLDPVCIAAALLHDVIEDTDTTDKDIEDMFGEETLHIVLGVTKLSALSFDSAQERQAESIRTMLLAMADDIRVILIKLADRVHNMRTLQFHRKEDKKRKIAQETIDIYAPIASRLGIYWIKKELEDTSFMYLQPEKYSKIVSLVNNIKGERDKYIETTKKYIKEKMLENNIKCEVLGRYKHFYGIHQKMLAQHLTFDEVHDIIAFRIVLDTVSQCYNALGLIHDIWKPVAKKFKDYIGFPKPNMYQALHTTVIGHLGKRVEIQIRTWEMDKVAKTGIAAHWSYKEDASPNNDIRKKFAWIQKLIENQANFRDPNEFLENVRMDLFPYEVYVFTPNGDIKILPKGATPVDFAYLIHTDVGNQCTGCRINGRMTQLSRELKNGQTIEIITSKNHHPSKDWLNFVKTVKACSKIRQWIKNKEKSRSLSLGKEMCEKAFRKHRLNFNEEKEKIAKAAKQFGVQTVENLIANVGYGKITPLQIIRKIRPQSKLNDATEKTPTHERTDKPSDGVIVNGIDDVLIKFGKCCKPIHGDPITGYITQGYGVTIHRTKCINAMKISPERQVEVQWSADITETYPVKICVSSYDRSGLLADIAIAITKSGANIINSSTKTNDNGTAESFFTLTVKNTEHLHKLFSAIKKIKNIYDVNRMNN